MSERLERVTAFSELREGMIVVVTPCPAMGCGEKHRAMLVSFDPAKTGISAIDLSLETSASWEVLPSPPCANSGRWISARAVSLGVVYRVLDGLEEPSAETAAASTKTKEMADAHSDS